MRYLLLLALLTTTAHADADDVLAAAAPTPPAQAPATGKMVDKVVEMTNHFLDQHVDLLTHDMLYVRVDAEHRAAKIAVGGGDARLMKLRLAGNVEVVDGTARIHSRLAVGVGGKQLDLRLPNIDVAAASYRGERGVEVRLPLLRRSF